MDGDNVRIVTEELETRAVRLVGGRGDAELIAAYEQHHDGVYGFLRRATRDADTAEDLLQETFARLLKQYRSGRPPEHVQAWLYRVASNLVISRGRRVQTVLHWLAGQRPGIGDDGPPSPETAAIRREWSSDVSEALSSLSTEARTALLLHAQGFSGREIAVAIDRSEAATRVLMCRARQQMRQKLERREVDR
jgi:RNA polymerase sigma-70 factor, ECF subfamily